MQTVRPHIAAATICSCLYSWGFPLFRVNSLYVLFSRGISERHRKEQFRKQHWSHSDDPEHPREMALVRWKHLQSERELKICRQREGTAVLTPAQSQPCLLSRLLIILDASSSHLQSWSGAWKHWGWCVDSGTLEDVHSPQDYSSWISWLLPFLPQGLGLWNPFH